MTRREQLSRQWCDQMGYDFVSYTDDPEGVWYDLTLPQNVRGPDKSRGFRPWGDVERDLCDWFDELRGEFAGEAKQDTYDEIVEGRNT